MGRITLPSAARAALVAMALAALAACDSAEVRAEKHYQRGEALLEAGETARAMIEFRNALRLDSEHLPTRRRLGASAESGGNLRNAIGHYREVARLAPDDAPVRVSLARLMLAGNDVEQARRYIDEAQALSPEDPEVLTTRAALEYRLGNVEQGLDLARRAIGIEPDMVDAHIILIAHDIREGRDDAALAAIDPLLERNPDAIAPNLLKLQILAAQPEDPALEAHLAHMVEQFPEQGEYRRALAQLQLQKGDIDAAEAQLRALADQGRAAERLDLARFLLATRDEAAARRELEAAVAETEPRFSLRFRMALAELDALAGDVEGARARLEETIAIEAAQGTVHQAMIQLAALENQQGRSDEARAQIEAVLEQDRDNVAALTLRARLHIDDYRLDDAIQDLRRAQNLDPQNAELMLLEALAHERAGNTTLVGERLASAARASDFSPPIALRYAAFLRQQARLNAAGTVLEEAARRNPDNRAVLSRLAEVRLALGDRSGADEALRRLRAAPEGESAADRLSAAIMRAEGRFADSEPILERLVAESGGDDDTLSALIEAYLQNDRAEEAIALLDQLIADNPANLRALALRAEFDLRQGDMDRAEGRLRQMIREAPDRQAGYQALGRLYFGTGRRDEAKRVFADGIEAVSAPENGLLRLTLAAALEQGGDYDGAIEQYRALYELNPDQIVVVNNLASLLAEFHADDPEALAFAARISRRLRDSSVPEFLDTYGWVAFLNGDFGVALGNLERAAAELPNNPIVRYHLGRVYAAVDRPADARAELEAALAVAPGFSKAASARELLATLPGQDG